MKTTVDDFLIQKEYCPTKPWFDRENNYYLVRPCVIQEYADQQTKELRKENVGCSSLNLNYLNQIYKLREEIEMKDKLLNDVKYEFNKLKEIIIDNGKI